MRGGLRTLALAAALTLAACATRSPRLPGLLPQHPQALELTATPFFPQREFQCGPAALATVLHGSGVLLRPDDLVEQVYLPARQGSLQVEMLASTRRAGRIPYEIDPTPQALFDEISAGRPVLVLQNLGLDALPVWHYAVVIGLDAATDSVILRSGTERRLLSPAWYFLRTWRAAGAWAMIVLTPGELPATVDRRRYLHAAAIAEPHLAPAARRAAYRVAVGRWPDDATAGFGLAYAEHASGHLAAAEAAYRDLLGRLPRHAAARNNLAEVLTARGCHRAARSEAQQALATARADAPGLVEAVADTLTGIPQAADTPGCDDPGFVGP